MRTRWSAYVGISVVLAGGVVVKSLAQRPNFYSAAVYLSQSSANLMILTNMIFVVSCTLLLGLQQVLYGPLRPTEIEQLYEKAWFAVTETCLAMTIFRGEIGAWFLVMFFTLLAGKVWAWIGEGRVEILEQQPPRNPRLFHSRLALSLGLSVLFSMSMLEYVVKEVMHMARPDMMVMFGFEFAVLSIMSLSTASRYAINLAEIAIVRKQKAKRIEQIRLERLETSLRQAEQAVIEGQTEIAVAANALRAAEQEPVDESELEVEGWEGKGRWIFYLDLATDFCKLVVYLSFFFILLMFYGLPIHILRDVFMTCRSFFKRIADFVRYRTATRDMNERYPDATAQEIEREDTCIICREEMRPYQPAVDGRPAGPVAERMRPKKLPCGHILHFSCLRSWLERQQICPTCRTSVVPSTQTQDGQTTPAGAQGAVAQHNNAPRDNAPRERVFRLGPLRVGVGARLVRGNNLLEDDMQNQGADDQVARGPRQANINGAQEYRFGIRWGGTTRRERSGHGTRAVQDHLNAAERQIQRELDALGASMTEMQVLRQMSAELARLRAARQSSSHTQLNSQQPVSNVSTLVQSGTRLSGNPQSLLQAGSEALPAGLTLPDGWTMMPLHQAPGFIGPLPGQTATMNVQPGGTIAMPGRGPHYGGVFPQMPMPAQTFPIPPPVQPSDTAGIGRPNFAANNGPPGALNGEEVQDIARNMAEIVANRTASIRRPDSVGSLRTRENHRTQEHNQQTNQGDTSSGSGGNTMNTTSQTTADGGQQQTGTAPVSSLPAWGSNTGEGSSSWSSPQEDTSINGHSSNVVPQDTNQEIEATRVNQTPSSPSRKHNPTVEDLVDGPD